MGGGEEDGCTVTTKESNSSSATGRKAYWRSQSWSASRSAAEVVNNGEEKPTFGIRYPGAPPLTPRSQQNCKARSCLPPLQPLSIERRSVDEWPKPGSDDLGDWPQPPTPSSKWDPTKSGEGEDELRVDLSILRSEGRRSQIAFFDKECSKVADHIYLGGDVVARNREILRKNGITHVLNCVGFVCPEYFKSDLVYKTLWLQDSPTEDITSILYDVFDYFEDVREQGGRVLVHCCQGVSRSTSLVIAYLMWRKGQSFDDAFDFVKAARGIANPNMGFACQLLQCQKRVHAIPLSPNSVLRMYRMAPHSPYDALHLVPKLLNDPSPLVLDSRGAFILHVLSSIYLWVGKSCKPAMEKDARAAAYQVVRYERVPGPIYMMEEGDEPFEFWEAFLRVPILSDTRTLKMNREHFDSGVNIVVGNRKVTAYDADFEIFYKGLAGGVVPPFSSAGAGHETHLPARESNWSLLRRKFIFGGMKSLVTASKAALSRVYSDSLLARQNIVYINRDELLSVDSSASHLYSSPSSLYSDSSNGSKSSSDTPLISPSIITSPATVEFPPNSEPSLSINSPIKCKEPASKVSAATSLAQRRKNFKSSLKLAPSIHTLLQSPRGVRNASTSGCAGAEEGFIEVDETNRTTNTVNLDSQNNIGRASVGNSACISAYLWPDVKRIEPFCRDDLDSKAVYLFLINDIGSVSGSNNAKKLYVWIGSHYRHVHGYEENGCKDFDWNQVALDFINSMRLHSDIPMKVIREAESENLMEWLK